ncbi:heterokaryon incompatibility protein-domain-containing protein, partial [Staphylotrichum tortipilum]
MSQPWHQASCRRPDVTVAGGTPFCSACDALADCTSVVSHSGAGIPRVPDLPPGGIRNLSWPSSVPYHQDDDYQPSMGSAPGAASVLLPANPATNLHASQGPYAPLETSNHIRLLRLSKGDLDDPIHGVLITASLDDNSLDFEALSYAWADESGDASRRKVTYIGRFWDMLPVTANCFAALRHMRRVKHDILVWVDAICINQGNHTERNSQVGLMTRIYSSARELFVYLGEGDSQLEAVVGALGAPFRQEELADPDLIQALFRCRYFSRMWIIQEVANAKTAVIHYGAKSARWAGLAKTRLRSLLGPRVVQSIPTWITAIYNQPRHNAVDLPRLLHITASSEAADPRDRIFALFGLLTDAASHGLVADYNLALPEVLTGYAAFVLLKLNQPWMLDRAVCNNAQQLPTWVPEWQ